MESNNNYGNFILTDHESSNVQSAGVEARKRLLRERRMNRGHRETSDTSEQFRLSPQPHPHESKAVEHTSGIHPVISPLRVRS